MNYGFLSSHMRTWSQRYFVTKINNKKGLAFHKALSSNPFNTSMPPKPHITLTADDLKSRVIIIGDIHGCLDETKDLLVKCKHDPKESTVIFVGDLINKGPYSVETVKFVRNMCDKREAYCVRGNHDDFIVAVAFNLFQPSSSWTSLNPKELTDSEIQWLNELPYTISLPSLDAIVVHAGLIPDIPLEKQTAGNMHSMRNINEEVDGGGLKLVGYSSDKVGKPWIEYWKKSPHVYFGHDAKRGLQLSNFATGLDTGCVYGKVYFESCENETLFMPCI